MKRLQTLGSLALALPLMGCAGSFNAHDDLSSATSTSLPSTSAADGNTDLGWPVAPAGDPNEKLSSNEPCINSGDETAINAALNGENAIAIFCANAVFNINNPYNFPPTVKKSIPPESPPDLPARRSEFKTHPKVKPSTGTEDRTFRLITSSSMAIG